MTASASASPIPAAILRELGELGEGLALVEGPTRSGNERRWQVRLADGRLALLAQLVDELAGDASIRRRYRRDVARMAELARPELAPLLAWGPRDDEGPPWRLRPQPDGPSLEAWIAAHAPVDPGTLAELLAALCDRLALLHEQGLVIRDLAPAKVIVSPAGPVLIDIGLARVDILSTQTAASLVLEGSPYAAPELLTRTAVDGRADLYGVGVIAFRALTGQLPFPDTHALLRPAGPPPHARALVPTLHPGFDELVVRLLDAEPGKRPAGARLVADILRGRAVLAGAIAQLARCQSCGAAMPLGQRLCTACGKLTVQFEHAGESLPMHARVRLVLRRIKEDAEPLAALQRLSGELCEGVAPTLNFLVGDARMYSEDERQRRIPLPCTLFTDLDPETARRIQARYAAEGITLDIMPLDPVDRGERMGLARNQKIGVGVMVGTGALVGGTMLAAGLPLLAASLTFGAFVAIGGLIALGMRSASEKRRAKWGRALMQLRRGPAALPASDPHVARLAALLRSTERAPDVRELLASLALIVQRLVDHREHNPSEAAQIDMASEPVGALLDAIERQVEAIAAIDAELRELDEGRLVRALAAARARDEAPGVQTKLLDGLERLRELEVLRAERFGRLLEAADLMRRSVELALAVQDAEQEHERQVRAALLALSPGSGEA